jgi:hypothetical protein
VPGSLTPTGWRLTIKTTVKVWGKSYEISVHQRSKTV